MTVVGAFQSPHLPLLPGLRTYQRSERIGEPPANPAEAVFSMLAKVHPRACDILDTLGQQLLDLKPDVLVMLRLRPPQYVLLEPHTQHRDRGGRRNQRAERSPAWTCQILEDSSRPHAGKKAAFVSHRKRIRCSSVQRFTVDHSVTVPLHFLTPGMTVPVVPVYINGLADPLISSRRAAALGRAIAETLDEVYGKRGLYSYRVAPLVWRSVDPEFTLGPPLAFPIRNGSRE